MLTEYLEEHQVRPVPRCEEQVVMRTVPDLRRCAGVRTRYAVPVVPAGGERACYVGA